jgi:ABC-type multidrug transport system fused ATPase/permease subunit
LWLAGLFLFGQFFNWGNIPFDFHDWAEISAPRIAFVQDAVKTAQLPLHMPDGSALRNVTDRYMALPDVILAPQMLLLAILPVGWFVLVNVWLMYSIGLLGLVSLWRRLRLSPMAFAALFFIFNFNGQVMTHFGVGHVNYTGYFLYPILFVLLMDMVESDKKFSLKSRDSWRWLAGYAFLLFFMLLNGSFHQFIWALMLTGLAGVFRWRNFLQAMAGIIAAGLLSAFRLLPPALHLGQFDSEFLSGYPSLMDVWTALSSMVSPDKAFANTGQLTNLGWWEFDLFVGLTGAVFLLVFGLGWWMSKHDAPTWLKTLAGPSVVLFVLSIGSVYKVVMYLPIPLINGERVSARLITLPFVLLMLAAAYAFQRFLDEKGGAALWRWIGIAGLFLLAHDLWQNLKLWRVNVAAQYFPVTPVNLAIKVVSNHPDAAYTNLLLAGACITLIMSIVLMIGVFRKSA